MARPNLGDVDDDRYRAWQDAADSVERPFNVWASRALDKAAKETKKAKTDAHD